MRFNLTPASHRVLERASRLRIQRGITAISSAKVLWAIFEENECRAAHWLQEAELSLEQFLETFAIPSQHPADLPNESEHKQEPTEPPKYSLYTAPLQGQKSTQSRLQFYLDEEPINIGLFTPELEDDLETTALRFLRQDRHESISHTGGTRQIALSVPAFMLTTEHLLFAVVLDNSDAGRWLRDNGLDAAELYQRIDMLTATQTLTEPQSLDCESTAQSKNCGSANRFYRLLDAAANRGREAIRVIEDYVRFILDDADLTQRLKTYRHQFQHVLQQFPMDIRLAARNTEHDVGTDISAEGEYQRPTVGDILSANFSRLQESLRSLEEFSKMVDPHIARQFENLRYKGYTLQKDVLLTEPQSLDCESPVQSKNCGSVNILRNARLYALVDTRSDESAFKQFVTDIIEGGVDIIQLRDKQADDRTLLARSRILKDCIAASEREVLFMMNDRPDLALLAGADGVHVGQEELPVALVRQIVGMLLIGVSTHLIEQARQAVCDGADYIGAGPVYESSTKVFTQFPGLSYLREVEAEIEIPAFAIGGITEERLEEVLQTGINRIAMSSALLNTVNGVASIKKRLTEPRS